VERYRLLLKPGPVVAVLICVAMVAAAIFAPLLAPHDPMLGSLGARLKPPAWEAGGLSAYPLGTDLLGRDVLSRLIYGARVSLSVAVIAIFVAGSVGSLLGILAGYLGGWVETAIMRLVDLALSLPVILIALLFGVLFGPSFTNVIIIISLVLWSQFARMARGETIKIKQSDFIDLARTAGCSKSSIMFRHVLPNVATSLIVLATLQVGTVIIIEASLSFLGVGVPSSTPAWGAMIAEGRSYIASAWWLCIFPGLAILLTVLAVNIFGDALTDMLNPSIRRELGG
jgi:peptide/nickel transport system permease protein